MVHTCFYRTGGAETLRVHPQSHPQAAPPPHHPSSRGDPRCFQSNQSLKNKANRVVWWDPGQLQKSLGQTSFSDLIRILWKPTCSAVATPDSPVLPGGCMWAAFAGGGVSHTGPQPDLRLALLAIGLRVSDPCDPGVAVSPSHSNFRVALGDVPVELR